MTPVYVLAVEVASIQSRVFFLLWGCGFFVSDVISGGLLGHLGPFHLALGPNR